jgi:hypothetical protein
MPLARLVVGVLRDLDLAPGLGQLQGRGVGDDLEEGIAGLDPVPHLTERGLDDARDLALDRNLPLGADGAHGQGLLDDRALGHGHRLVVLFLV